MPKKFHKDLICLKCDGIMSNIYSVCDKEIYNRISKDTEFEYIWFKLKNAIIHTYNFERELKNEIEAMSQYNRIIMESFPSRNVIFGNIELDKTINKKDGKYFTSTGSRFVNNFTPKDSKKVLDNFKPKYEVKAYSYESWYSERLKNLKAKLEAKINEYS